MVRAAAESDIPLISAVGHETDWTLIDHAADWRAPTPTAAAEKAVPVKAELEALLADYGARLRGAMSRKLDRSRSDVVSVSRGLASPDTLLAMPRRRFDEAAGRIGRELNNCVRHARSNFSKWSERLSPLTLERQISLGHDRLTGLGNRKKRELLSLVGRRSDRFEALARQVRTTPLQNKIEHGNSELERLQRTLLTRIDSYTEARNTRLERSSRLLSSLSYKGVLERGYAVIRDEKGKPLTGVSKVKSTQKLSIEMQDGHLDVISGSPAAEKPAKPAKKSTQSAKTTAQGDLF